MNYRIFYPEDKKNPCCQDTIAEFEKRLGRYCKIIQIPIKKISALSKYQNAGCFQIKIHSNGKSVSSLELSEFLNHLGMNGIVDLDFYIDLPLENPDEIFSLSSMDMPPALSAAILYEQIYRSYRIINHQPYHK